MAEMKEDFAEDSPEVLVARLRETFKEEAYDLIAELETALLELEKKPQDLEVVSRVFRSLHTIKGSGGACEFHDVAAFAHELETVFDSIRKGRLAVTKEIIDLALAARDQIKAMFDVYYADGTTDKGWTQEIITSCKKLLPEGEGKKAPDYRSAVREGGKTSRSGEAARRKVTYRIRFRPEPDLIKQGQDPVALLNELRCLGQCKVVAQTDAIPHLENLDPEACYTYWDVILTTDRGMDAIHDVFIFVKDQGELRVDIIDDEGGLEFDDATYKKLGDILVEKGDLTADDLEKVLKKKKKIGEMLVENGVVNGGKVESALDEQRQVREAREKRRGPDGISSIRVSTEKLDGLVNLVGELVTVQARLSQIAALSDSAAILSVAEEIERLTAELRDSTMSIRMLPIGTTFSTFRRVVRDLSKELGKEVELTTEGAETELDKTVIERLGDPLVHLIRNSIGHGIERPEARLAGGKPRKGTIHLAAVHSGANVLIQIKDDGAGIDMEAIRARAVEKGMVQPEAELSEKEIFDLIFTPGFSTAKEVTSVSGRGVGLDVVKKAIDSLRGSVEITSRKGEGTVITLKLPLTLAIIDGFLTKIGEDRFVFPLSLVEECVELSGKDTESAHGRDIANVRGEIVPYIRLRDQFGMNGGAPERQQIVITRVENRKVGFVVDQVIGGYQTVIKNLGRFYRRVNGISGATILGDGTVALILDVPKLVEAAEKEEARI